MEDTPHLFAIRATEEADDKISKHRLVLWEEFDLPIVSRTIISICCTQNRMVKFIPT